MVMARNLLDTSWRRQDLVDTDMVGSEVFDCVEGSGMDEELEADRSVTDELQRLEEARKREGTESSVVRWEEYMPKMVIRVLLVEADDSTRQIIAALLRKCNYKVAAIPDGLKAWEILKQRHSNIDLILTEVDLPLISGYALLTLIMEHDGCKKIPVIMMSSCDSMTTVFKCMLKGAADFLIKPVRRNELKNLWQHVWRRLSTNNEQGQQNSPSGHCNIKETSKSREPRSHSDDDASSSLKISHFAYKANDAQVALEQAEVSALRNGHWERDSSTSMISRNGTDEVVGSKEHVIPMRQGVVDGCRTEKDAEEDNNPELKRSIAAVDDHGKKQQFTRDAIEAVDLIGRIDHHGNCNSLYGFYPNYSDLHNSAVPGLELSLRRSEDLEDPATSLKKRKLNHVSAFARYNSGRNSEDIESTARFSSPEDAPTRSLCSLNALSNEENHRPHLAMNPSKTNTDLMDDESQIRLFLLPGFKFDSVYPPPMSGSQTTKMQAALSASKLTNTKEPSSFLLNSPTSLHSVPVGSLMGQSGEISNQEHNTTISGEDQQQHPQQPQQHPQQQQQQQHPQQQQQQQQEIYAKQHGGCQTSITGNNSAVCSGSSDGLTNKSTMTATTTTTTPTTAEEELVNDNGTIRTNNMPMHCDHQLPRGKGSLFSPQRVAALAKFRQKRKDRCFEKKVRYQSRKRLAEQRPRVKGQFVRQLVNEQPNGDDAGEI